MESIKLKIITTEINSIAYAFYSRLNTAEIRIRQLKDRSAENILTLHREQKGLKKKYQKKTA